MKFLTRSLSRSLTLKVIAPLFLAMGLVSLVSIGALLYLNSQELEQQVLRRAEHLAGAVQYFMEINHEQSDLIRIVNSIGGENDIELMVLIGENCTKILACSENSWIDRNIDILDDNLKQMVVDGQEKSVPFFLWYKRKFFYAKPFPYYKGNGLKPLSGVVILSLHPYETNWLRQQSNGLILMLFAGYGLIGVFGFIIFRRHIRRPVKDMLDAMERRRKGDIFARSPVISRDELGLLSKNYNETLIALSQAEERFQQLASHTDDVFWIYDLVKGQVLYVNDAFERVWGCDSEILYANPDYWMEVIMEEDRPKVEAAWREATITGGSFSTSYRLRRDDNSLCWILDNGLAVKNESGEVYRIVGIARDITTEKMAEIEYIRARDEAEHLALVRSRFLANMSHEIRTPLNGILGASQLLLDTDLDKEQIEWGQLVNHSCRSLLAIINDILDLSKIEAGKLSIEQISFDLKPLLKDVYHLLKPLSEKKDVVLNVHYPEDNQKHYVGDPVRIRQVLINLLGNAVKFTNEGRVDLSVSCEQDGDWCEVIFKIEDTGIGIPKGKHDLVFNDFSQVDGSISRQFGGTGLGLSISRHLAHLMNGDIRFDSEEGVGSTFYFRLVLKLTDKLFLNEQSKPDQLKRAYQKCVLLAEDQRVNQRVAMRLLEKLGIEVTLANDGLEAVDAVEKASFDLILMDMQMPLMDGLAATKKIRTTHGASMPIIAMTANAMDEDRDACFEVGMNGFLSKPIKLETLVKELDKWFIEGKPPTAC